MDNIGGAELVTLTLARELRADVYSTVVNQDAINNLGFDIPVRSIGWVPKNAPFRQQLTAYRFKKLNLSSQYDFFIISGDWAASGSIHNKPNLWIIYSPPRELWDLYQHTRDTHVGWWGKWIFDAWVIYNRKLTKENLSHTTAKIAISKNVQRRVQQFFHETVSVIYPPTDTTAFRYEKNGDFWLSVNRLIDHKRIEMQLSAFQKLPQEKLVIVGSYEQSKHFKRYAKRMIETAPKNVTIKSWITAGELRKLYATCKGFITTSLDEDYGMNVVEAMASGKPVIAPNEGGYKETMINGETGMLIDDLTPEKLALAIEGLKRDPAAYKERCQKRAHAFDTSVFMDAIHTQIQKAISVYTI